jgi:uncharacterized protein (TIGR00251 family)
MNCKNALSSSKNGVLIHVYVIPGSSQSVFPAGYNTWRNCLEIKVQAEARDNKANREVLGLIAEFFHVSPKDVGIVSGRKGREKTISIQNLHVGDVSNKLEATLHGL